VSDAQWPQQLEEENCKPKKLANEHLNIDGCKAVLTKKL
jgi:hypothetical protein